LEGRRKPLLLLRLLLLMRLFCCGLIVVLLDCFLFIICGIRASRSGRGKPAGCQGCHIAALMPWILSLNIRFLRSDSELFSLRGSL